MVKEIKLYLLAVMLIAATLSSAVAADDWTMYHHDLALSGYSTSTAPDNNQTMWISNIGSVITSSPAIVNGVLYIGAWNGNLYALNAYTGAIKWSYPTGHSIPSSPAVAQDKIYFLSEDGYIYALNSDGTLFWKRQIGPGRWDWSSPSIHNGKVFVGTSKGSIYSLDANNGSIIWNTAIGGEPDSPIAVVNGKVYSGTQNFDNGNSTLVALDESTGTVSWKYNYNETHNNIAGMVDSNGVTVVDGDNDGTLEVYFGVYRWNGVEDNTSICLYEATGKEKWTANIHGNSTSSPAVHDGKVFIGSDDFNMYALDAGTGAKVWSYPTMAQIWAAPAVADGKVFFGSLDHIFYALNENTGSLVWKYNTSESRMRGSPGIADCMVFTGNENGKVYAFGKPCSSQIGDYVWDDANKDGIQDAGEPGISGIKVNLYDDKGTLITTTTTDGNGLYKFIDLLPGNYVVEFVKSGSYIITLQDQGINDAIDSDPDSITGKTIVIILKASENNMTIDAGMYEPVIPKGSIGDFVWNDLNGNGIQDAGEPGIANVTVNLYNTVGTLITSTTTNVSGYYSFTNLDPGNYIIGFVTPAGYSITVQNNGSDDTVDSDPSPTTALTASITLNAGDSNMTIDAGMVLCKAVGDSNLIFNSNKVYWTFTNTGTNSITINSLDLSWPSSNGKLKKVKNGSFELFSTATLPPYVINVWKGTETDRTIASEKTMTLTFEFEHNADVSGEYIFMVNFAQGCSVKFPGPGACRLGYPDNSNNPRSSVVFSESEVLRGFAPTMAISGDTIKVWYNDEHALTLGVRQVIVKNASGTTTTNYLITPLSSNPDSAFYPLVGTMSLIGDQAGTDISGRPMFPALFITDITSDPTSRSGDWQQDESNVGLPPHAVFGTWKGAVRTVTLDKNNNLIVTIQPDADPAKNNWNLDGGDPAPDGLRNEGYGAEVRWNVDDLGLQFGHTYRMQFMVHDGDQNKAGGDVGEACTTVDMTGVTGTASIGDYVWNDMNGDGIQDTGEPGISGVTVNLYTGSGIQVASTITDASGYYRFDVVQGNYYVGFVKPAGYDFSPQDQGTNNTKDSDANTTTGKTTTTTLLTGENDLTWDAGMYANFCKADGDSNLIFDSNKVDWKITNAGINPITIDSIELNWPSSNGKLKKVKNGSVVLFDRERTSSLTVIPGSDMWKSGTETSRTIAPDDSTMLRFEFEHNADNYGEYIIKVNFAQGCSVEFKLGTPPGDHPNECGTGTKYPSGYKIRQLDLKYNHNVYCDSQTLGVCNNEPWGTKWNVIKGTAFESSEAGTDDRIIESTGLLDTIVDNGEIISIMKSPLSAFGSNTYISVYDNSTISEANKLEYDQIHTSCSAPIRIGDKFGSFEIVDIKLIEH